MKTFEKYYFIQLAFLPFAHNLFAQPPPTLGNYPDTMVVVSANTTVTPDAAATGATSINVAAESDFKGILVAHPGDGRGPDHEPASGWNLCNNSGGL